jgi:phosphoglycolate phosphatase
MTEPRTHVLLDLDGTLSDSEPGILRSLQWACEQEGFPIPTDAEVRSVIGPPFEIGLPSIGIPDDALERVIDTYRDRYTRIGAFENTLYDGILDMLDALAGAGLSLSIATVVVDNTALEICIELSPEEAWHRKGSDSKSVCANTDVKLRHVTRLTTYFIWHPLP